MNPILKGIGAATVALALAATAVAPAAAQMGRQDYGQNSGGEMRRGDRNDGDRYQGRFERRGNAAYFNNHRGYSQQRSGYRRHNGFWFPPAAFIAGAIVGGAIANSGNGSGHVEWCASTYRSYRAYDNTFQPYNGPRQLCVSPYG